MESRKRATLTGRMLAAGLLAGVLALAWFENRSALAQSIGAGKPILGWLQFAGAKNPAQPPALFLTVYQPARRSLTLVYMPSLSRRAGPALEAAAAQLAALAPAQRDWTGLPVWTAPGPALGDEPPLDAADWLLRQSRAPRSWLPALFSRNAPGWPLFDRLLLALDLVRLGPKDLHPAWLPPQDQAGAWLNRILTDDRQPAPERATVEVLNASGQSGIASRAKNLLRLHGADVMSVGNVERRGTTLVYDRTGRFDNAVQVARMLGCPAARPLTKVDLKSLVDVTVVLAEDCPLP